MTAIAQGGCAYCGAPLTPAARVYRGGFPCHRACRDRINARDKAERDAARRARYYARTARGGQA